jgi:SPP1 family predicted phage head-tail adaptor
MRAGRLRHLVTIQQNAAPQSATGAAGESWSAFKADVWAAVEPIKGREYHQAGRVNAETTHLILLRHVDGVTPGMRVAWDGRTFDIQAVINRDERDRELELTCIERLAG